MSDLPPVESDPPPVFLGEPDGFDEPNEFDAIFSQVEPEDGPPQACDGPGTYPQNTREQLANNSQNTREQLATAPPPEIDPFAVTVERPTIPSLKGPAKRLLTREERENVVALVAGGTGIQVACKALRISTRTFWNTVHADAEFARSYRDARMEPEQSVDQALLGLALDGSMPAMIAYLAHCRAKRREKLEAQKLALERQKVELIKGGMRDGNRPDLSMLTHDQLIQLRDLFRAIGVSALPPPGP